QGRPVAHHALFPRRAVEAVDEAAHHPAAQDEVARAAQGQAQHLHRARTQHAVHLHEGARLGQVDHWRGARRVDLAQDVAVDGHAGAAAPVPQAIVISRLRYTSCTALSRRTPSAIGRWKALRPEMRPIPPARLLMMAVLTASLKSLSPEEAPPELIRPARPM